MKYYVWDNKKNEGLKRGRGVSFEEVVFCIEGGYLLDVIEHPKKERYKGQHMYIVRIRDYAYLVPFIERDDEIVLKTIIPNRKATRKYLKRR